MLNLWLLTYIGDRLEYSVELFKKGEEIIQGETWTWKIRGIDVQVCVLV